ncbi:hypothetical protein AGLY_015323 [Aphis glycines]|uniref:Uncharacterized protein n=1 Tax=Aphis glycines TaxID=307491 RepID=A0A6G0T258_APHGL|nr:hypothetical protein AGLY_015323 [Aphis glycines]
MNSEHSFKKSCRIFKRAIDVYVFNIAQKIYDNHEKNHNHTIWHKNSDFQNVKRETVGEKNTIIFRRKEETVFFIFGRKEDVGKKRKKLGQRNENQNKLKQICLYYQLLPRKSRQVGTAVLYIKGWGGPRTRLFEAKLMENLVLNFLTLDINTNNFMNFELQNNLQIFMILTNFCQNLNFKC